MKDFRIKQHDATDCGPACLASVCAFYGLRLPLAKIRQLAGTNASGTTLSGLMSAAQKFGLETKAVSAGVNSLRQVPKPAIAHLQIQNVLLHYVVILRYGKCKIEIMDPANGKVSIKSVQEFSKEWTGILMLLVPGPDFKPGNHKIPTFKRFLKILKPHRFKIVIAMILSLVFTLLGFTIPVLIQILTDLIIPSADSGLIPYYGLVASSMVFAQMGLNFYKDLVLTKMGVQIDQELIERYYRHLMRLPQTFFDHMKVGEIISRVGDAVKIRNLLSHTTTGLFVNGLVLLISVMFLFSSYWKLGLLVLSLFPLYGLIYAFSNKVYRNTERRIMEHTASFESQMIETIRNIRTIRSFGIQDFAFSKTQLVLRKLLGAAYDSSKNHLAAHNGSRLLSSLISIALLSYGAMLVVQNLISLGELLSFYAITAYFTGPIVELIMANKSVQNALIASERLFDILDLSTEDMLGPEPSPDDFKGEIRIEALSFGYEKGHDILRRIRTDFKNAEITAVVGASGSGKSTLLGLVQGLYAYTEGSIRIGKHELSQLSKNSINKSIASVPQKIEIFSGSLLENIALGQDQPDIGKVKQLVRLVGLDKRFGPHGTGLQTRLGENGAVLSGGESRKLALARALYKDPQVLLLDELTSSLDGSSERALIKVIQLLSRQGLTIILTSHRWSTILCADQVVLMNQGQILESGPPEFLIRSSAYLKQIIEPQAISSKPLPISNSKNSLHEQP